jgi:hypothetical protein
MDVIAAELSQTTSLSLHAVPLWVGSHSMGYGIVFFDDSMAPRKRTPEGSKKLEELEKLLETMDILMRSPAKLATLCSAACRVFHSEPYEMIKRPAPPGYDELDEGRELMRLTVELNASVESRCALSSCNPILAVLR